MNNLIDKPEDYSKIDKSSMINLINGFPEDFEEAIKISSKVDIPSNYNKPRRIVVCGMGGSAIGGDILKHWLLRKLKINVIVVRDYKIPVQISDKDLVFTVSYSGNTEETLSCLLQAINNHAMIFCITSNGIMEKVCEKRGIPYVKLPKGRPPRTALAFLFTPMPILLEKLGLRLNAIDEIRQMAKTLRELREEIAPWIPHEKNMAKQIALSLKDRIATIYAYVDYYPAAFRFKTQLNENSKHIAKCELLPELDHNEIMGWEWEHNLLGNIEAIFLLGGDEPETIKVRVDVTAGIIAEKAKVEYIRGIGESYLEKLFTLIYMGDYISYYLAIVKGVDPTPIKYIDRLKSELAKRLSFKREIVEKLIGSS